jgi:hypothetical protein
VMLVDSELTAEKIASVVADGRRNRSLRAAMQNSLGVARCLAHNSVRHSSDRLIPAGLLLLAAPGLVSSSGEVGKLLIEDPEGTRADRSGRGSTERVQASGAGGVGSAPE